MSELKCHSSAMRWSHLLARPLDTDFGVVADREVFAVHSRRPAHTTGTANCCHQEEVEISFVLDGVRFGHIAGEEQVVRAGEYQYFPPGVPHRTETRDRAVTGLYVQVPVEMFRRAGGELGIELWQDSRPPVRAMSPELKAIVAAFQRQTECNEHDEMIEALGIYLVGHLIRDHVSGARLTALSPSGHEARLGRVVDLLNASPSDDYTLDELARVAGLSKFRFAHVFKARFGLTPYRYLERIRVLRAAGYLAAREATVSEAAYELGFPSSSRFATVFRRELGLLPSKWCALTNSPKGRSKIRVSRGEAVE